MSILPPEDGCCESASENHQKHLDAYDAELKAMYQDGMHTQVLQDVPLVRDCIEGQRKINAEFKFPWRLFPKKEDKMTLAIDRAKRRISEIKSQIKQEEEGIASHQYNISTHKDCIEEGRADIKFREKELAQAQGQLKAAVTKYRDSL